MATRRWWLHSPVAAKVSWMAKSASCSGVAREGGVKVTGCAHPSSTSAFPRPQHRYLPRRKERLLRRWQVMQADSQTHFPLSCLSANRTSRVTAAVVAVVVHLSSGLCPIRGVGGLYYVRATSVMAAHALARRQPRRRRAGQRETVGMRGRREVDMWYPSQTCLPGFSLPVPAPRPRGRYSIEPWLPCPRALPGGATALSAARRH